MALLFGVLIFIATSIRFYILLQRGHFRIGSKKDELRERFDTNLIYQLLLSQAQRFCLVG